MHRVTFEGLLRLQACIGEWSSFLDYHVNALNHCWDHVKKVRYSGRADDPLTVVKGYMAPFSEFMRYDIVFAMVCNEMLLYDETSRNDSFENKNEYALYKRKKVDQ